MPDGGGHLRWTFAKTLSPVVVPIQPPTGSRCGARGQPDVEEVSGLGAGRPLQQHWRLDSVWGGVVPRLQSCCGVPRL